MYIECVWSTEKYWKTLKTSKSYSFFISLHELSQIISLYLIFCHSKRIHRWHYQAIKNLIILSCREIIVVKWLYFGHDLPLVLTRDFTSVYALDWPWTPSSHLSVFLYQPESSTDRQVMPLFWLTALKLDHKYFIPAVLQVGSFDGGYGSSIMSRLVSFDGGGGFYFNRTF